MVLSILFFMSFSLKRGKRKWGECIRTNGYSQSSFSWAFLWNIVSKWYGESERLLASQSSFSWAFLWNAVGETITKTRKKKDSQSSFSWAFLWNLFYWRWWNENREIQLSILFFMSFSLKRKGNRRLWAFQWVLSQSSFSWAFLWNSISSSRWTLTYEVTNSQSSFSWAFLWNISRRIGTGWEESSQLSILFFMSFSLKPKKRGIQGHRANRELSILFFMSFSLKLGSLASLASVSASSLSILFFMSFSLKRKIREILFRWLQKLLSILFFMSFSLKQCLAGRAGGRATRGALNPLFHELFSETGT